MFAQDEWPDVYPPGIGRGPGITTEPISIFGSECSWNVQVMHD